MSGNYAYVAASTSGLRIIDISNPASPIEAGFYDTPGSVYAVAVSGSLVYVADGDCGLRILQFPIPPVMELNAAQHDFGSVTIGDSLSWNGLYIKNIGSLPFSIDSLEICHRFFPGRSHSGFNMSLRATACRSPFGSSPAPSGQQMMMSRSTPAKPRTAR